MVIFVVLKIKLLWLTLPRATILSLFFRFALFCSTTS